MASELNRMPFDFLPCMGVDIHHLTAYGDPHIASWIRVAERLPWSSIDSIHNAGAG